METALGGCSLAACSFHSEQEMSRRISEMAVGLACNWKQLLFVSRL